MNFFRQLGLFLVFFGVSAGFLYIGVYSEESQYPTSNNKIVISEIRPSGGIGKTNDEYIEIHNIGNEAVAVAGWGLSRLTKSASSTDTQLMFTFPVGTLILPKGYLLVAHADYQGEVRADYQYIGQALADDNTVVLINEIGEVVDLVGYGVAKNAESGPAYAPVGQLLSIERLPGGGLGNYQDTNNNELDFFRAQSNPQNAVVALPVVMVTTSTPEFVTTTAVVESVLNSPELGLVVSSTNLMTTTTVNISPTTTQERLLSGIYINELYPIPETGQVEFVELFNNNDQMVDLTGWYLVEGSGAKTSLFGILEPKSYLVVEKPKGGLNNAGDWVGLFAFNQSLVDKVMYGDWVGSGVMAEAGKALIRTKPGRVDAQDSRILVISTVVTKGSVNILGIPENIVPEEPEESLVVRDINQIVTSSTALSPKTVALHPRVQYSLVGQIGMPLLFDASLTTGGQGFRKYLWEMDDGGIVEGEKISYVYFRSGNYSVTVTVIDESGAEKSKTVKVVIEGDKTEIETKKMIVSANKDLVKNKEEAADFVVLSEIDKVKTNSFLRIRGVLAGIIDNKTTTDFYLTAESQAGGSSAGILVKTKNTNLDARIGDVIELTGKYITNAAGNYFQFSTTDQLSVLGNGENIVPVSSTISAVKQMSGGYVQIVGEVVDKKANYIYISDSSGEIKAVFGVGDAVKLGDRVALVGYIIKTKEGNQIKLAGTENSIIKQAVESPTIPNESKSKKINPKFYLMLIGSIGLVGGLFKKYGGHK